MNQGRVLLEVGNERKGSYRGKSTGETNAGHVKVVIFFAD